MASLITRSAVLVASRTLNYGVRLLSPIFLVRLLEVEQFGQYREFLLYATLFATLLGFSVKQSLVYFVPKFPERQGTFVTQTAVIAAVFSLLGVGLLLIFSDQFLRLISFDFVGLLAIYLIVTLNLDYLEFYWLARKRSDLVFYYSSGRFVVRTIAVLLAAWLTRDVQTIIWSLVALEAVRLALVLLYSVRASLYSRQVTWESVLHQVSFFAPLGFAQMFYAFNTELSKLFVATSIGTTALALYVVGAYAKPILDVVRSSVADVIFPEMVTSKGRAAGQLLELWRRATDLFCMLLFPMAILGIFYAETFVVTLFTDKYAAAAPVFMVYMALLVRDCFDFNLPLRALNKNIYIVVGSAIALTINLALIVPFFRWYGLIGPALAYLTGRTLVAAFSAFWVLRLYRTDLRALLDWNELYRVVLACGVAFPVLIGGRYAELAPSAEMVLFGLGYVTTYLVALLLLDVRELKSVLAWIGGRRRGIASTR